MKQIKTDEERARLDEIFALVEAELNGEPYKTPEPQKLTDDARREQRIQNNINAPPQQIAGNIRQMIRDNSFKTSNERIFANAYLKLFDQDVEAYGKERKEYKEARQELEMLRNFTIAVSTRLEKAEKTAKEQDNHHYYKIFAESVRTLLNNL